jgi:hypothetical protein
MRTDTDGWVTRESNQWFFEHYVPTWESLGCDGFDQYATILAWDITAHEWPAQRAITGHDLPVETPVRNLWNVGDGVKLGANAGTAACVRTADAVVSQILSTFPVESRGSLTEHSADS